MARKELLIQNKTYLLCDFYGEVVDTNRQRETKVYGSGGGGATYNGYGGTAPISINSVTTVHDEFFLIDEHGNEEDFHLMNWELPLRTGHKVQMIWIVPPNKPSGPNVVMNNKNLKKSEWNNKKLHEIASAHYIGYFLLGLVGSVVVGFLFSSFWLFLIVAVGVYIFYNIKTKEIKNRLISEIEAILV